MAAEDAVFVAANAREEVRKSLDRMIFHLGRGQRGARGVAREVDYLDALSRQAARLGQQTGGALRFARGDQGLGQKALGALRTGNSATVGRAKSSLLAGFSDDVMWGAREWTYLEGESIWVWIANGSACAACLANHGSRMRGAMYPEHPSCLCYPEQPASAAAKGVQSLSDGQLLDVMRTSNNPRWRAQADLVDGGRMSVREAIDLNRRPGTTARYRAETLERLRRGGPNASVRLIQPTGRVVAQPQPASAAPAPQSAPGSAAQPAQAADDLAWQADDFVDISGRGLGELDEIMDDIQAQLEKYELKPFKDIPKSPTNGDESLEYLYGKRGYHGKATKVDDIDDVVGGFDDEVLLRGVPQRKMIDNYIDDPIHRGGDGIYGQGTYTAMERGTQLPSGGGVINHSGPEIAAAYSQQSGNVFSMKLKPGARVIDTNELTEARIRVADHMRRQKDINASTTGAEAVAYDDGYFATVLGYDAIHVPGSNYVVVLNRSATYVSDMVPNRLAGG